MNFKNSEVMSVVKMTRWQKCNAFCEIRMLDTLNFKGEANSACVLFSM